MPKSFGSLMDQSEINRSMCL